MVFFKHTVDMNSKLFQTPKFLLNGCISSHEKEISSQLLNNNLIIQLIGANARLINNSVLVILNIYLLIYL